MTLTVESTLEQIAGAIRRLSPDERLTLFRLVTNQETQEKSKIDFTGTRIAEQRSDYVLTRAELDHELALAAEALLPDYTNDKALTAFTALDAEEFYAAK